MLSQLATIRPRATAKAPIPVATKAVFVTDPNNLVAIPDFLAAIATWPKPSDTSLIPKPTAMAEAAFCSNSPKASDSIPKVPRVPTAADNDPANTFAAPSAACILSSRLKPSISLFIVSISFVRS